MRLGFIIIWGKGKTPVTGVNLIYNGNTEAVKFIQEADKEVSDTPTILMEFFKTSIWMSSIS